MKKGQLSIEYLMILGLSMIVILGAVYIFYAYVQDASSDVVNSRINEIGTRILQQSESIHGIGKGTWIVIDINIPDELVESYIMNNSELVFVTSNTNGVSQSVFFSNINISGEIPPSGSKEYYGLGKGKNSLRIESKGGFVLLNAS
jgi:hypothetical protein